MVRITMINRRGKVTHADVAGTLVDVVGQLSHAHSGLLNFGEQARKTVVFVADIVAVEPLESTLPAAPTRGEILAEGAARDQRAHTEHLARKSRRAACVGGSELVVCPPGGVPTHHLVARPAAEVVWKLVTAGRDVAHLDDGLGRGITVRIPHVQAVHTLE